MQIPQPNISAYRTQYSTVNQAAQIPILLVNENIQNQRTIGASYALSSGLEEEGSAYRGYGCYASNTPDGCCNIYCPIYYNRKAVIGGGNEWFV